MLISIIGINSRQPHHGLSHSALLYQCFLPVSGSLYSLCASNGDLAAPQVKLIVWNNFYQIVKLTLVERDNHWK